MKTSAKHYDVVVVGCGLGALVAAALLARRSFRVLVVGHGHRSMSYGYDGLRLARRPFTFLAQSSPAWGRVLVELAQSQTFRRRLTSLDPMFQVLGPNLRLEVPPDTPLFAREVDREFGSVRRVVDDLYAELTRVNAAADAAFERDLVLPPGGFWERREASRALADMPYTGDRSELLAELSREHPFREVVTLPARFASDLAEGGPPFATARLHGAWTRGVSRLAGAEDELTEFLFERIRAHGGEVRLDGRVAELVHAGGAVKGVAIDGDEQPVGASFVVTDLPGARVLDLAPSFVAPRESVPLVQAVEHRFVVSIVAKREGLPSALASESFLLPWSGSSLPVRLQRASGVGEALELLVAEVLLDEDAALDRVRASVLETVSHYLPFLERHLVACDSPHDGLPLWDFRAPRATGTVVGPPAWGLRTELVDRAHLRATGGSLEVEPMVPRYQSTRKGLFGLAGEPLRAALGNVFITGKSALPGLGQEGELLAAWGVARLVTRTDRRRAKMLRDMWSKVELS